MVGEFDPRLPFWLAAAACLTNACSLAWLVLPESLPPTRRTAFSWKRAHPVGAFNLLLSRRQLLWMVLIFFLISMVTQLLPSVFVIYTEHRYGWPRIDERPQLDLHRRLHRHRPRLPDRSRCELARSSSHRRVGLLFGASA